MNFLFFNRPKTSLIEGGSFINDSIDIISIEVINILDNKGVSKIISIENDSIESKGIEMKESKIVPYQNWRMRKLASRKIVIDGLNDLIKKGLIDQAFYSNVLYSMGNMNDLNGSIRIKSKNELLEFIKENKIVTLKMIFEKFEIGLPEMKLRIRSFIIDHKIWVNYDESKKEFSIVGEGKEPDNWKGYRQKEKKESIENISIDTFEPKANLIKKDKK